MPQPQTFLIDTAKPNEQTWANRLPIPWTAGRGYAFNGQVAGAPTKALWYKTLDGGITWSKPDLANSTTVNGLANYYFDGQSPIVNMVYQVNAGGVQSPVLQDFNFDTEKYTLTYGAAGAPSGTMTDLATLFRMANGSLMVFFHFIVAGNRRAQVAVFSAGVWTVAATDFATNLGAGASSIETIIPDPVNNLCHVYYSSKPTSSTYFYRQITSAGALGAITSFPGAMNLTGSFLNFGRAFNTGYLKNNQLIVPVFTSTAGNSELQIMTGTPTAAPIFSLSGVIDSTAGGAGTAIAQAITFLDGNTQYILYFCGDGTNLYNLVKLATNFNDNTGWHVGTIYDATQDPNAAKNTFTNEWINAISGSIVSGVIQFEIATFGIVGGFPQNTVTITTRYPIVSLVLGGGGNSGGFASALAIGGGSGVGGSGQAGTVMLLRVVLPDPKVCKNRAQRNRKQFQKNFTLC